MTYSQIKEISTTDLLSGRSNNLKTYSSVINKINKVFDSCTNRFQIVFAERYCKRLVARRYVSVDEDGFIKFHENYYILQDVIQSAKSRKLGEW